MPATRAVFAAFLMMAVSCSRASQPATSAPRPVGDKYVITNAELQDPVIRGMDALRAIRYLRPIFFRDTGPQSFMNSTAGAIQFSMDYGPVQPLSQMANLAPLSLQMAYEVRYLDVNDAQNRFGLTANGGPVIVVVSNKQ